MDKNTLSDEENVLLLLSIPVPEKRAKNKLSEILIKNHSINQKKIYRLALANGVAGFVYKNAKEKNVFPDAIIKDLHTIYMQTAYKNMHFLKETLAVLQLLHHHNIITVPLKGSMANDLVFNDFGVYPSGDIDILVHPSDLQQAKEELCHKAGYDRVQEISEQDLLSNHYHLMLTNKTTLLEIHWNLVKRYFEIPSDFWFEGSRQIVWNGVHTYELAIEKYIMYHIFRLFDHCFYPLRFYVLLGSIIDQNADRINWEELIHFAGQYNMKKLVIFSFGLLNDVLETNIPEKFLPEKNIGYKLFKDMAFKGIFSGIQNKHRRMMLYTLILVNPGTLLCVFTKRIFPSKGELRLRYNIPPESKKIYLFYIFNPFLLLFKKSKTR
jgi:hypothetical protein